MDTPVAAGERSALQTWAARGGWLAAGAAAYALASSLWWADVPVRQSLPATAIAERHAPDLPDAPHAVETATAAVADASVAAAVAPVPPAPPAAPPAALPGAPPATPPGDAPPFTLPRMPGANKLSGSQKFVTADGAWVLTRAYEMPASAALVTRFYAKALDDLDMRVTEGASAPAADGSVRVFVKGRKEGAAAHVMVRQAPGELATRIRVIWREWP